MKILVTGSRNWPENQALQVESTILEFLPPKEDYLQNMSLKPIWHDVMIIHGDCPTGVDAITKEFCRKWGITNEIYFANWLIHGKAAGPIRNKAMVNQNPDICLAFPYGLSRGTYNCIDLARLAGITVVIKKLGQS